MSGYPGAGDGVSDSLAMLAAVEIDEPQDVEDGPRAVAVVLEDAAYAIFRVAQRLEETALHPNIIDQLYDSAMHTRMAAHHAEDLADFRLVRG